MLMVHIMGVSNIDWKYKDSWTYKNGRYQILYQDANVMFIFSLNSTYNFF